MKARRVKVLAWLEGSLSPRPRTDHVAVEEPLEIRVETRSIAVTMRTPGHDDELAAGFLLTEGLITHHQQIARIKSNSRNPNGNVLDVFLAPDVPVDFAALTRHVFASSSCGLCGKASIKSVHQHFKPVRNAMRVSHAILQRLPGALIEGQQTFAQTGGLHAAALFNREGELVVLREDIGRHNAVDKVIGHGLLRGLLPFDDKILMVSGRASFEIMQKALAARCPIVAAISAPSSLAVDFARRSGQALIGFLRHERMNIYCGAPRIGFQRHATRGKEGPAS